MKFKVQCGESSFGRYYEFIWDPVLRGDCSFLYMGVDAFERRFGRDGVYFYHLRGEQIQVIVLREYKHNIPTHFGEQMVDGVYYDNFIKIHYKVLKDKLPKMKIGEEITLTTWDELYNQEEIREDLLEIRKSINREIEKRQGYGVRPFTTIKPGYVLFWSNVQVQWFKQDRFYLEGEELKLDANEIFIPYTSAEIEAVIQDLSALPLYAYSFEGKAGLFGRPQEQLEEYLVKLVKELQFAKEEGDKLKQRNLMSTMTYIKHLLEEGKKYLT